MRTPTPTVGRTVHYVSHGSPVRQDGTQEYTSQCRLAFITEVSYHDPGLTNPTGDVSLMVVNPTGLFFREDVPNDPDNGPGTWHWPERVEE